MRKLMFALILLVCWNVSSGAEITEPHFLSYPNISPDGSTVVFCYQDDIWFVSSSGGPAYRLTAMDGIESHPAVSPDGKWIAFSGRQEGQANVYIMPFSGGEIKQLTFHDADDLVESWSWDGKHVYFTSTRHNHFSAYRVSISDGTPERLFEGFFNTINGVVEDPQTGGYYFTNTWESFRFAHRKRYKGDYNPDINYYDSVKKEFKQLTTYNGKDLWPTVDSAGTLYFASDEANDEYNLYTFRDGKKTKLTGFASSIWHPRVSANGKKVVFEKDYQLHLYDVTSRKSGKINVLLHRGDSLELSKDFNIKNKISHFNMSPDGKKMAFVSRGELFVSDIKGKFIRKIETSREGRIMEVSWLKDNKTLIFNQTVGGWLNWFTVSADGTGREKQVTSDEMHNRNMMMNGAMSKAVYYRGRNDVRLIDLKTFKSKTIVSDELWGFYNDTPRFSPDDRFIVFTAYRNFEKDIIVYDFQTDKTINITGTGVTEAEPFWSPDGRYLYFSSDRYRPRFPGGSRNTKVYRLPLEKFQRELASDEFDKLFKPEQKKNKKSKVGSVTKSAKEKPVSVTFDFAELMERWDQVSPNAGSQYSPFVLMKDRETSVLYLSNHDGGKSAIWKTTYHPFEKTKTEKIKGSETYDLSVSKSKGKLYALVKGVICEIDLKGKKAKPIKMSYIFRRNMREEFRQMFYETWANMEENFYDDKFHGVEWLKIRDRYASFLPYVSKRADLRRLLNDMLGELNTSHFGFYSFGEEEKTFYRGRSMSIGLLFENSRPYVVNRVIKRSSADKKGVDIKTGDVLVSVNGQIVNPVVNREKYFLAPSLDKEICLGFRRGGEKFEVKLNPSVSREFKENLYNEWENARQSLVDKKGKGKIAYIHMKDMGRSELKRFLIEMTTEWYKRDALILDLRYNRGGNVHNDVLSFLIQRPYTKWKYRGGKFAPQPNFAPAAKPIVLLVNEQSLSDAEMTAAGFKALKLGKIIGTETYRWLIFTSSKRLVDGSVHRLPCWGCYTLDGKDIEITGVAPDIYLKNTFLDRIEDRDPQLERAIEEVLKEL